jgi:hypothetical protein
MSSVLIARILGGLLLATIVYFGWKQIPKEDPKTIAARKEYG